MKKLNLKKLALQEALAVRHNASSEEIERICPEKVDGFSGHSCIYGQMTGDCTSQRAVDLIYKCAPVILDIDCFEEVHEGDKPSAYDDNLVPCEKILDRGYRLVAVSPIEILIKDSKMAIQVANVIKGKRNTLK